MVEIPAPVPSARQALVQVLASTINIDDIHVAEGTFYGGIPIGRRPRAHSPVTPGSDLAGIVVSVGKDVRTIKTGDAVFGVQMPFRRRGAWAEFCAVDESWIVKVPEGLSFDTAAACGVSGSVALSAMEALKLQAGMQIVIVGATGGIGAMAVKLSQRAGARVIGVCGPANIERAYALGCSLVLDYRRERWDKALARSGTTRVDRVLDVVGGSDTEQSGRLVLDPEGRFVTVVGPERFIGDCALSTLSILSILARVGYRIASSRLRGPRYVLAGPGPGDGKLLSEVAAAAAAGVLPPIDSVIPFNEESMRKALQRAAAHRNNGRIVIQIAQSGSESPCQNKTVQSLDADSP